MVPGWFFMVFHSFSWFYGISWFFIVFHGFSWFSWFQVGFSWFFIVFHGFSWFFLWFFMVSYGSRSVFHGFSWFFMVFHGFSWYFMVPGWFFSTKYLILAKSDA